MRAVIVGSVLLALSGCQIQTVDSVIIQCVDPRPQVCTMEYAPVCATVIQGGKEQYPSACNACADDAVAGYLSGACTL